jgi:Xaa-Pro aminopeptidase
MREYGADDIAFATIVASGPNSAIPHHEPTDRELKSGDFLKIDFGAKFHGYHADCTRTVVVGRPASWQVDLHSAVSSAQEAGRNTIRSEIAFIDVEKAVNQSLNDSGYRKYFTHGLGHGVGLEIHEDPFFGRVLDAKIASNTVITIEPGAYLKDKGGVRVEDTIVVNSEGHLNLTELPYELLEL